jgi:anti-sigma factor RsiW
MSRQSLLSQFRKKPGPPPTGKGTLIGVRLQPPELARVDAWIAAQDDAPSRPEAIRRILDKTLPAESAPAVTAANKPAARKQAKRAKRKDKST